MSSEEYLLSLLTQKTKSNYAKTSYINQRACPFVKYHKDRLSVKYVGKGLLYSDISSIQANNPANKDTMIFYYELKINDIGSRGDISVGLSDADFPLNKHPGWTKKSYGYRADGKVYSAKQPGELVMPKFTTGSYVGCGINYFKREIFFTFNGKYQGPAFKDIELQDYYPTIGLHSLNENVTFNFGLKPFKFDIETMIIEEKKEGIQYILQQPVNHYFLHQIIQSYLYFHGYTETLEAFEKAAQIEKKDAVLIKNLTTKQEADDKKSLNNLELIKSLSQNNGSKEMEIETLKKDSIETIEDQVFQKAMTERMRSESFQIEFESPVFTYLGRKDSDLGDFSLNRESSLNEISTKKNNLNVDFNGSISPRNNNNDGILSKSLLSKHNSLNNVNNTNGVSGNINPYLLEERSKLRKLIIDGNIQEAISYLNQILPNFFNENIDVCKALHAQQFIEYVRSKDCTKAIEYAQNNLNKYQNDNIWTLDPKGLPCEISMNTLVGLICYLDPYTTELKELLSYKQKDLTADIVNKAILKKIGYMDISVLDLVISHIIQMEEKFREQNNYYGEIFDFKV